MGAKYFCKKRDKRYGKPPITSAAIVFNLSEQLEKSGAADTNLRRAFERGTARVVCARENRVSADNVREIDLISRCDDP